MPTDASNMGRDKRRARLEQRRAVVARDYVAWQSN